MHYINGIVADIQKLKELGELRDSGILTQDEFEKEKAKILGGDSGGAIPASLNSEPKYGVDYRNKNLPPSFDQDKEKSWIIWGGIVFVILLIVILSFGNSSSTATVTYDGCWSGAFSDGDLNIISIDGCGNESFDCGSGGYCGINAQKQDDSSARLCVSVGSNEACTTAAYGVASV